LYPRPTGAQNAHAGHPLVIELANEFIKKYANRATITSEFTITGISADHTEFLTRPEGELKEMDDGGHSLNGDYFQTATGTLRLHIGGTQAGSRYDQLVVNGLATLDGTLAVALAKGFRPHSGDPFQVLLAGGVQGAFRRPVWNALARFALDYADGLTLVAN
jgi:hypothetical protein